MDNLFSIRTDRLLLRQWDDSDFKAFANLNADARVMEFFPFRLTEQQSDDQAKEFQKAIAQRGFGFWAVEALGVAKFIGFIGISPVYIKAHFCPHIEIAWCLAYEFWGKGYATEGAKACLEYAFEKLHLKEVVAFTVKNNERSRSVMEKIGMTHNPNDDFDHPNIEDKSVLKRQVLYRICNTELLCPCGSGVQYGKCCHIFHSGKKAATCLALMRSRYSGYAFGDTEYIITTTHPLNPMYAKDKNEWKKDIASFSKSTTFAKLEILEHTEEEQEGIVIFKAHLFKGKENVSFTEKSYFEKIDGYWLYKEGYFL